MPVRTPRRNFVMALTLFLAWVGVLGWMAAVSGERPRPRPTPATAR